MKKRVLSMLLVIVMVFGLLPMGAMAAEASYPDAEWYNFRNSDVNMGITNVATPKSADYTQIKWTSTFGEYIGTPIIVDGYMYIAAGSAAGNSYLYKLSLDDGSVVDKSALAIAFSSNNCNVAPTYVQEKGLIIVPMTEGVIQAFNISNMSSAWVYQDKSAETATVADAQTNPKGLGGQCQTPIVYADGKLYGGFYVSSTGNFVCLDAATGALQWYYPSKGGFYWSGAVAVGDYIVVGSEKGNGNLLLFSKSYSPADADDPIAEPKSSLALNNAEGTSLGNQRSSMAYDAANGRVYFTSTTGYICSAAVDTTNGALSDLKSYIDPDFTKTTASTSTPVVYGDYVYYSAGNSSNGYYFIVANKSTLESVAKVKILGKSQCSWLLSTAYASEENYLYFYGTYNVNPGGVTLIKVPTTAPTSETLVLEELYDAKGYEQYCINSPICTTDGTIYYKNDSNTIFALTKAEVAVPEITTNLDAAQVKYGKGAEATALTVSATVADEGTLSYQWQSSADKKTWSNIENAKEASYTPSTAEVGTTYYRCVVTNTKDGKTATATSVAAEILVKVLSTKASLNVGASVTNSLTSDTFVAGTVLATGETEIVGVVNYNQEKFGTLYFGAVEEGSFDKTTVKLYQGLPKGKNLSASPSTVTDSQGRYTNRYTKTNPYYTLPFVASVEVTAEDGVTKNTVYIVIDNDALSGYTIGVSGLTADSETYYNADSGISFTAADQSVTLTPVTTTIGSGEEDKTNWTWTSSDNSVAVVDEKSGTVKCIGGGEATITFTCGQMTASCKVSSTASEHFHSYVEGKCSVCGTEEPDPVSAYFSIVKDGDFLVSKDGTTELYKTDISVTDADFDGAITINDAFIKAHTDHSTNGTADFVTEEGDYGPYITKLWGVESSSVGYFQNNTSANGLNEELKKNDVITAYFYQDTTNYSDIYTYVSGQTKVAATNATTYTVSGVAGGKDVSLKGATVKVYDSNNAEVTEMATTVGDDSTFALSFAEAGTYTVEVSGSAAYTGSVWDSTLNNGEGGYKDQEFSAAPVIPSRIEITVVPYAEKTVYVSISMKSGEFAVGKGGEVMHYYPVTATDNAANPDGSVTIAEVLEAAHVQYHADGASAVAGISDGFITKLWGESNSGNASYYFNDLYMSGSGSKTGSNGRVFQDKLLNTVVEDNDHYYIYSFQAANWAKGDLYTYFYPITETATSGEAKTFTVKSATGYGTNANKLETSLVKVTDASGTELTNLATTVGSDGSFTITFPSAGTYTVDVRTNGTNYVTPARCTVTVTAPYIPPVEDDDDISVYFTLLGDSAHGSGGDIHTYKAGNLETWVARSVYSVEDGSTVWELVKSVLAKKGMSCSNPTEGYIESITYNGVTVGEFTNGEYSGWKYLLDGEYSSLAVNEQTLYDGAEIVLHYTDDYTVDDSGDWIEPDIPNVPSTPSVPDTPDDTETEIVENEDGSVTTTVTDKKTGTVTETTVTTTGVSATVVTDSEGKVSEMSAEIPAEADTADAVTIPVEVKAEDKPVITITTNSDETVTVEIPVADVTTGTVAILVAEDGSETVIVESMPTGNGVTVPVEDGATIKIVDNSIDFNDINDGEWHTDAVDFVSARGIMNGTGNEKFDPKTSTTRAMVWTMLARLDGVDTSAGETWYEAGQKWAVEKGVSDGTMAMEEVTREQLVTMIWRYIGEPDSDHDLSGYNDHHETSDWAKAAKQWAVENGVIKGVTDTSLDPTGEATRAQVAQMFMNFLNLK